MTKNEKEKIAHRIMADIPFEDVRPTLRERVYELAYANLPEKVRMVWDDTQLRGYVSTTTLYWDNILSVGELPYDDGAAWNNRYKSILGADGAAEIQAALDDYKARRKARTEMQERLMAEFVVVRTHKQFIERFPDLAKYLPAPVAAANVPATTDLMDKLRAAGLKEESEG